MSGTQGGCSESESKLDRRAQQSTHTLPVDMHQRKYHQQRSGRNLRIMLIGCCAPCPEGPESSWQLTRTPRWKPYTWIGRAGSFAKVESQGWNENGRALYRLLRDHHLTALNTHGAAQKPTWTHIGPQENHRRLDYIVTHVLGAESKKAWRDFTAPVALSGYGDHRPVRAMIPTKAVIAKTTPTQGPPRWNSDALLEARWDERYAEVRWVGGTGAKEVP